MGIATYFIVNSIILGIALLFLWPWMKQSRESLFVLSIHILVLTAVFDSLIVWSGIVAYDSTKILGLRVGVAPIEDFFYAIAAILIVPALWKLFGKRKEKS